MSDQNNRAAQRAAALDPENPEAKRKVTNEELRKGVPYGLPPCPRCGSFEHMKLPKSIYSPRVNYKWSCGMEGYIHAYRCEVCHVVAFSAVLVDMRPKPVFETCQHQHPVEYWFCEREQEHEGAHRAGETTWPNLCGDDISDAFGQLAVCHREQGHEGHHSNGAFHWEDESTEATKECEAVSQYNTKCRLPEGHGDWHMCSQYRWHDIPGGIVT